MPSNVNNLIDRVKTSCDNESYMFVYNDDSIARAYSKEILDSKWESRILSKQYFESEEFNALPSSRKNELLYDGVMAYDADELDPVTNNIVDNPSVFKYTVNSTTAKWEKTNYKAVHKIVTNYGITQDYYAYYNENESYYIKHVMKRMIKSPCTRIYYKNSEGKWFDYFKYINALPSYNIELASKNWPDVMKINSITELPKCKYIDKDGYIYDIDAADGSLLKEGITYVEVDTNDWEKVSYTPCSINDKDLPFSARHIMNDLKITIPEGLKRRNFLTWLNGTFVPTIADSDKENVMYIENAMYMIGSKCINQTLGASHVNGENATVIENESNNEYRYDANLRFFGWNGVSISEFYKPSSSEHTTISYNYENIYPIKSITFPVKINKNAHIILCNGKILDPNEYSISVDGRSVTLKNIEQEGYDLLNEIVHDINEDISFYNNVNPLKLISRVLTNKTYSLVNFESEDDTKVLKLMISSSCCVNYPYKNEVTFPSLNIGDMILVKGLYVPYEWIHINSIRFPKTVSSFEDGTVDALVEDDVKRYYFVLEDKE